MTYQTLYLMAAMGLILSVFIFALDKRLQHQAWQRHWATKARACLLGGYVRAEMMVQHRNLTHEQRCGVLTYIGLLEHQHNVAGQGPTLRFDRLRETLTANSRGLSVFA